MEVEVSSPSNFSEFDVTNSATAASVMDSLAEKIISTNATIATAGRINVERFGAVVRTPSDDAENTTVFATIYTFNGTEGDLTALVTASQSCRDLSSSIGCSLCVWGICELVNTVVPSVTLHQFLISVISTSLFNVQPHTVSGSIPAIPVLSWSYFITSDTCACRIR